MTILKYKGEDYESIVANCRESGSLYVDKDFHPEKESSFGTNIEWLRPKEFNPESRLFPEKGKPGDVIQGALGNCWFIAALSTLCLSSDALKRVLVDPSKQEFAVQNSTEKNASYTGCFRFHFWRFGSWIEVVVDDKLPTKNKELYLAKCSQANEMWPALIEKAYAKLNQGYDNLDGGNSTDALVDFTGGVAEKMDTREYRGDHNKDKRKSLYRALVKATSRGAMVSCSISNNGEARLRNGLIAGHAYGVVSIKEINHKGMNFDKFPLLKLRNPWGNQEWNGAWSDDSEEWKKISKSEKKKIGLVQEDDGEFWMSYDDLLKNFTTISICRLINTSHFSLNKTWRQATYFGKWEKGSAGGCPNSVKDFIKNPQYVFTVMEEENEVMVSLMQKDPRGKRNKGEKNLTIGYTIVKVEENRKYRVHNPAHIAHNVTFIDSREVFSRFTLKAGRYACIPSTFSPNELGDYMLRIFSESTANSKILEKHVPTNHWYRSNCKGALVVTIIAAAGLEKQDLTGSGADPYCIVKCEGTNVRTPTQPSSVNPVFQSSTIFYVKNPKKLNVTIECMNRNTLRDSSLGKCKVNCRKFVASPNSTFEGTSPLSTKSGQYGAIKYNVQFFRDMNQA